MVDWQAVKSEFEAGASLRSLATKHSVPKTTLLRTRDKEHWTLDRTSGPRTGPDSPHPPKPTALPMPADAHSIARIGLHQLAQHLQSEGLLDIKDHKSLSDALAQYIKVLATPPEETAAQDGVFMPFDRLFASTRMEIRRLLAEDEKLHKMSSQEVS